MALANRSPLVPRTSVKRPRPETRRGGTMRRWIGRACWVVARLGLVPAGISKSRTADHADFRTRNSQYVVLSHYRAVLEGWTEQGT